MNNLKGTKTEANLMTAFAGESQARNKYTYYASKAKKEGLLWTHGADFELRVLGEIDIETGEVFPLPKGSEFLMDGSVYMMGFADDELESEGD